MVNIVSFPGLGLEFTLNRVAFEVFGIRVYWYGLIIGIGFLLALIYAFRRAKTFGLDVDRLIDVIIGGTIGGVVGARLYYVIFRWDYYKDNLREIFMISHGGLAIYGGIIGALLVGILMCKWRKVKILPTVDLVMGCFLLGQGIGRWGNFFNVEAYGCNTDLPWGMTSPKIVSELMNKAAELQAQGVTVDPTAPVHPTFFYESVWCLLGFLLLALYTKHRRFDGEITLLYLIWYGTERAVVEGLRTDSLMLGDIRISQLLSAVVAVVGLALWIGMRLRVRKLPPEQRPVLYANTQESQWILAGEYDYQTGTRKVSPDQEPAVQEQIVKERESVAEPPVEGSQASSESGERQEAADEPKAQ